MEGFGAGMAGNSVSPRMGIWSVPSCHVWGKPSARHRLVGQSEAAFDARPRRTSVVCLVCAPCTSPQNRIDAVQTSLGGNDGDLDKHPRIGELGFDAGATG